MVSTVQKIALMSRFVKGLCAVIKARNFARTVKCTITLKVSVFRSMVSHETGAVQQRTVVAKITNAAGVPGAGAPAEIPVVSPAEIPAGNPTDLVIEISKEIESVNIVTNHAIARVTARVTTRVTTRMATHMVDHHMASQMSMLLMLILSLLSKVLCVRLP